MYEYITTIGLNAFSYCKSLKTITIPESVFSIEHSCFEFCENLTSITIPKMLHLLVIICFMLVKI